MNVVVKSTGESICVEQTGNGLYKNKGTGDVIVHSRNEFPSLVPNEAFSVDVITYDEEGMMNIGFYSYDFQKWSFHTDTLVDYYDMDFVWMYKPDFLKIN